MPVKGRAAEGSAKINYRSGTPLRGEKKQAINDVGPKGRLLLTFS
jgi:hypothetical protein